MQGGFCFCQIGEFSFIIAGLGLSFGVIDNNLYPIIVSVSIITTFVTPYMIKAGTPAFELADRKLLKKFKEALEKYSSSTKNTGHDKAVTQFVTKQLVTIVIYSFILMALGLLSGLLLHPFIEKLFAEWTIPAIWGDLLGLLATLLVMAPFLWALAVKGVNKQRIRKMLQTYHGSQVAVIPLLALRYFIAVTIVGLVVSAYLNASIGLVIIIAIVAVAAILLSRKATDSYNRIEERFVSNLNQRQAQNSFRIPQSLEQKFIMERMTATP